MPSLHVAPTPRSPIALLAAALCLLAVAAAAPGARAQTVGAPLSVPANFAEGCESVVFPQLRSILPVPPSCTYFGFDAAGSWTSQTPRGSWTITRARVRTGPRVGPMQFTIVRAMRSQAGEQPAGVICCTSPAASQPFTPAPNTVNEIPVNLPVVNGVDSIDGEPVEVVDYLGITMLSLDSSLPMHVPAGGSSSGGTIFAPALPPGGQALSAGSFTGRLLLVNGDLAPRGGGGGGGGAGGDGGGGAGGGGGAPGSVFDLLRGARPILGGNGARLGAVVPGPGVLRAASPARAGAAAASAAPAAGAAAKRRGKRRAKRRGRSGPKLLRPTTVRVAEAGEAKLTVRLTRAGRKLRASRGRLRIPVRLTYTPEGGAPSAKTRKVTFKKPAPKRKRGKRRGGR